MTAQVCETLYYDGVVFSMATEPLNYYFSQVGIASPFESPHTALYRGYVGAWEISEGRLYLVGLDGRLQDGSKGTLSTLFHECEDRVFAYWYSGEIRAPHGKLLQYNHMGYDSVYERDLLIQVANGAVVGTDIRENVAPPSLPDPFDMI